MKAVTVVPLERGSASVSDIAEPEAHEGDVLVETLAVGVCGTDMDIVHGSYGFLPKGKDRLVLGHESLGRVLEAPQGSALNAGDLVVGIVRRPDPVPCYACAHGEWDACRNGLYVEHGIKELDGFMRERYRASADAIVRIDPGLGDLGVLLEPTTVVAKAWEQAERIGHREAFQPKTVLVVGAGPVGLLAALLGRQRGLEVHVVDQVTAGPKPELVRSLGATYHVGALAQAAPGADIVIECTGVPSLALDAVTTAGAGGVVCLAGISPVGSTLNVDLGHIERDMVLGNKAVFGSVNANRRHYEQGAEALAKADKAWLGALISRRVELENFADALTHRPDDVKVVIDVNR